MPDPAETARAEALARIRTAEASGAAELSLYGLKALDRLPAEIAGLSALRSLDLGETGIADIAPLAALPGLQIVQLVGTPALRQIQDLEPLMDARDLRLFFEAHPPMPETVPEAPGPFAIRGIAPRLETTQIAEWDIALTGLGAAQLDRIGRALLAGSFAGAARLHPGLPVFLRRFEGVDLLFLASRAEPQVLALTLGGLARPGLDAAELAALIDGPATALGRSGAAAPDAPAAELPDSPAAYAAMTESGRNHARINALAQIAAAAEPSA
ncbi:leucine-rich repeat domain-containing protein [Poseidonocella sp. HB161398]|uniref:leucine-rich repeat domain-containing protein n=1 Tax=Poseidonocella sp. HB161398 TaxID=2320855 RepID=UPI00110921B6|nr:leucine-rich repeat domain-containing protein [Poseidonocella sp. HB161398]